MYKRIILFGVLIVTLSASPLVGEELILEPSQDAFVCDCIPGATNPMLGAQYLAQGRYSACYNRSFIKWDLSSIPTGSTIDDAEFRIYCATFYGSSSGEMCYYILTEPWNESTVTYSNMPSYTAAGAIFTSNWPSTGTWLSVDITDFVSGWFSGSIDNYGVYCHSRNSTSTSDCAFYSSNVSSPSYRPRIVITYTPASAFEDATWGGLKAGAGNEQDAGCTECTGECYLMELPPSCPEEPR